MKKSRFKFISFIICTLFLLQLTPIIPSQKTQALTLGDYQYTLIGSNATITAYTGIGGDITVPTTIDTFTVTGIGDNAFYSCTSLTGVTIPDSVTSIGNNAFSSCTSLNNVIIGKGVTSIGDNVFNACNSLIKVTIPDNVTSIGEGAFSFCTSLTNAIIGKGVTSIGNNIFNSCTSLTTIDVSAYNQVYFSNGGVLYNKSKTTLISYPVGKIDSSFTVPNGVTSIDNGAFSYCPKLISLTIPYGVTSIGYSAFSSCTSLESIIIPDSVINIGDGAFDSCTSLASVTIPNGVTSIGSAPFSTCTNLTTIVVGADNKAYSSKDGILYDKLLKTLICYPAKRQASAFIVPDNVINIGYSAFSYCTSLSSVTIPTSVTSIDGAFSSCTSLTSVNIPNSVTSIGDGTFYACTSLNSVTIADSVTSIGNSAFDSCTSLTNVSIPNNVTTIGQYAFYSTNLANVTIPSSVTSIGDNAFNSCISLTNAKFLGDAPTMGIDVFALCSANFKVNYLYGKTGYTNPWSGYPTEVTYTTTYNGNGNTSGIVPVDSNPYLNGVVVTVLGNTGSLAKTAYTFAGWNTQIDGKGTDYAVGSTFTMGTANIILYAK